MRLWEGRFSGAQDAAFDKLNSSLSFDRRLAEVDVLGSMAWAKAITRAGLLSREEEVIIINGLEAIRHEFIEGSFIFQASDEDIHTAVERRLTERVGVLGGKLHTGRSRNDQVATDFRMWVIQAIEQVELDLQELQKVLVERAEKDFGTILPGYTHTQQAQPILLSHWWLSHFWALQRDRMRLHHLDKETRVMPLGSGALAGSGFKIDRFKLAADLGFDEPSANSIDAVGDRDFAVEFLFCAAMIGIHISQMAETLILFSTHEFGFVTLADQFSSGSSLMPQKKNPDALELARAKSSVINGKLIGLLGTLKGLPSAYDKDLQEDKPPVFEAFDILELVLAAMCGVIETLQVNTDRMTQALDAHTLATDIADYLVQHGVPFRQAHTEVGNAVKRCEALNVALCSLPLDEWKKIDAIFDENIGEIFNPSYSVERRTIYGGTASEAVREQLEAAKKLIA